MREIMKRVEKTFCDSLLTLNGCALQSSKDVFDLYVNKGINANVVSKCRRGG